MMYTYQNYMMYKVCFKIIHWQEETGEGVGEKRSIWKNTNCPAGEQTLPCDARDKLSLHPSWKCPLSSIWPSQPLRDLCQHSNPRPPLPALCSGPPPVTLFLSGSASCWDVRLCWSQADSRLAGTSK